MAMVLLIIVVLVLMLGGLPGHGPFYTSYGYYPIGLGTILLIILIVVLLSGRL